MWQNIGYILMGLGALALAGWAVWGFFLSDEIPLPIRVSLGVILIAVLLLLGIAIKDRLRKKDDFEERDN